TSIGQKWEGYAACLAEGRMDFGTVITDYRQAQSLLAKFFHSALQLHELRFAVWSSIRRSNEHEHRALGTHDRLERPRLAVLIVQTEVRHALTDLWPNLRHVDLGPRRCLRTA